MVWRLLCFRENLSSSYPSLQIYLATNTQPTPRVKTRQGKLLSHRGVQGGRVGRTDLGTQEDLSPRILHLALSPDAQLWGREPMFKILRVPPQHPFQDLEGSNGLLCPPHRLPSCPR